MKIVLILLSTECHNRLHLLPFAPHFPLTRTHVHRFLQSRSQLIDRSAASISLLLILHRDGVCQSRREKYTDNRLKRDTRTQSHTLI